MNTTGPAFPHGMIVPRLPALLRVASATWDMDLAFQDVVKVTGLNYKTVWMLARKDPEKQTREYVWRTVKLLCWYFGCRVDDLLVWQPPSSRGQLTLAPPTVKRTSPPRAPHPDPDTLLLLNHIPAWLKDKPRGQVVRATGLDYETVSNLQDPQKTSTRISRTTLAALCDYLSEDERLVQPGNLFAFEWDENSGKEC